jgi:hypothetical protein
MAIGSAAKRDARTLTTAAVVAAAVAIGAAASWGGAGTLAGGRWPGLALALLVGVARTTTA